MENIKREVPFLYKGYQGSHEYSENDDVYYGIIVGIQDLILYEKTENGLEYEFQNAVDDYLHDCHVEGIAPNIPTVSNNGWFHIDTAPKDGTMIDLFVFCGLTSDYVRLTDCYWDREQNDWMGEGYGSNGTVYMPIGGYDNVACAKATHWKPITPPEIKDLGDVDSLKEQILELHRRGLARKAEDI